MDEKKTQTITINDKDYSMDDFDDQEKMMVNHINDLDRKISSAKFNLDQLNVGREAFVEMLIRSVEAKETVAAAESA